MNMDLFLVKLHPASVHFPIALLLLASISALFYLYGKRLQLLLTLVWPLMGLGWIAAIGAALTGLITQRGLPPQAPYQSILNWHISTGLAQIVVYGLLLYQRWRYPLLAKQRARRRGERSADASNLATPDELLNDSASRIWITLLLLLGIVLILASGWNGGRLVFEWGVNVVGK
ncbi:MAG: DUF2231 domain-containing protein [Caldilineaceae bacterium]